MQFLIDELPENQLKLLGITKKEILGLPPMTLDALMSGNRTSLMRFNNIALPGMDKPFSLDAKLSLERKPDNTTTIKIHPINQTPRNTFDLNKKEIDFLKNNSTLFIPKQLPDEKGQPREYLVTLDKELNEYVAVDKDKVRIPEAINNTPLSVDQKIDFVNGKLVDINGTKVHLDPNSEIGLTDNAGGNKISNIRFKHSTYTQSELLLDLALIATGFGSIVMLGHLLNFLLNSSAATREQNRKDKTSQLVSDNQMLREALESIRPKDTEKAQNRVPLSNKEIQQLVENYLNMPVKIHEFPTRDIQAEDQVSGLQVDAVDEGKTEEIKEEKVAAIVQSPATEKNEKSQSNGQQAENTNEIKQDKLDVVKEQPKKIVQIKI